MASVWRISLSPTPSHSETEAAGSDASDTWSNATAANDTAQLGRDAVAAPRGVDTATEAQPAGEAVSAKDEVIKEEVHAAAATKRIRKTRRRRKRRHGEVAKPRRKRRHVEVAQPRRNRRRDAVAAPPKTNVREDDDAVSNVSDTILEQHDGLAMWEAAENVVSTVDGHMNLVVGMLTVFSDAHDDSLQMAITESQAGALIVIFEEGYREAIIKQVEYHGWSSARVAYSMHIAIPPDWYKREAIRIIFFLSYLAVLRRPLQPVEN